MATPSKTKAPTPPLGRYLRRFTLQNVRTFRSPVTLDFCHPDGKVAQWTVILGENGTGKTTLLQYLAGMMPVQDKELANVPVEDGKKVEALAFRPLVSTEEWLNWHIRNLPQPWNKPMELRASFEVSMAAGSLQSAGPSEFVKPFGLHLTVGETPEGRANIQLSIIGSLGIEYYEQFRMFGYGASRHVAGSASPYVTSDSFFQNGGGSPVGTLFHDDHPLISPEQWLLSLDHALARAQGKAAEVIKRAYESARRCLTMSLPDISEVTVQPYGFVTGQTPMTLLCKTPFSPRPVPFSALSIVSSSCSTTMTVLPITIMMNKDAIDNNAFVIEISRLQGEFLLLRLDQGLVSL